MTAHVDPVSVTVRLAGGLGNQLFQYAAARSVAKRLVCDVLVDTRFLAATLPNETNRQFELNWLVPKDQVLDKRHRGKTSRQWSRIANRLQFLPGGRTFVEQGFTYDSRIKQVKAGSTLVGYFQSWKYFDDVASDLRGEILAAAPRSTWFTNIQRTLNEAGSWAAVHVRRGDYLNPSNAAYHGLLGADYYDTALSKLRALGFIERIAVFSDDPLAAADLINIEADEAILIRPPNSSHPMESIALMAGASAVVTANSSFSWWGAWLAKPSSTMVVCPDPWFRGANVDENDLRPPSWHEIPVVYRL